MVEGTSLQQARPSASALFRVIRALAKASTLLKEMTHRDMPGVGGGGAGFEYLLATLQGQQPEGGRDGEERGKGKKGREV